MSFKKGSLTHVFIKSMDKAGVTFPTTKTEIINKMSGVKIQKSDTEFIMASDILSKLPVEEFPNGHAFMCAFNAALFYTLNISHYHEWLIRSFDRIFYCVEKAISLPGY